MTEMMKQYASAVLIYFSIIQKIIRQKENRTHVYAVLMRWAAHVTRAEQIIQDCVPKQLREYRTSSTQ